MSAAEAVGITVYVTDSKSRLETQLNRIAKIIDLPMMLVSWDIQTDLEFNSLGQLGNPKCNITFMLMSKAELLEKIPMTEEAEKMGELFQQFLKKLYDSLSSVNVLGESPITYASYTQDPDHGAGRHSGVVGGWVMAVKSADIDC